MNGKFFGIIRKAEGPETGWWKDRILMVSWPYPPKIETRRLHKGSGEPAAITWK